MLYSPKCVEGFFSEVHIQYPALAAPLARVRSPTPDLAHSRQHTMLCHRIKIRDAAWAARGPAVTNLLSHPVHVPELLLCPLRLIFEVRAPGPRPPLDGIAVLFAPVLVGHVRFAPETGFCAFGHAPEGRADLIQRRPTVARSRPASYRAARRKDQSLTLPRRGLRASFLQPYRTKLGNVRSAKVAPINGHLALAIRLGRKASGK
jgi:hypothetical protein